MSVYKNLLSPLPIRNFVLKNRMTAATSLPHFLQGPEPYPADPVISHYINKAKGAAVVTCMGINNFILNKQYPMDMDIGHFPDFNMYDCTCQNYLLHLTDCIHFYDSLAAMSIFVGPQSGYPLIKKKNPEEGPQLKPHEIHDDETPFYIPHEEKIEIELIDGHKQPHEYDEATLDRIAESFAEQAEILKFLGFDMLSLHFSYRANLPAKFFSPLTNHRTDKWGGSFDNRKRFPLMVLERLRKRIGDNMLIEICWSAEEEEGGYSLEESAAFLREAAKYIDIVQLRAWDADISHPTGFTLEEVPFVDYSEYMKKNVPGLIIESIGGYQDPETCEKVIAGDKADLISMARAWISNTDYGRLVKEGRRDDIVPCIRCNKCHGRIETEPMLSVCTVNPIIGLEHRIDRMVSEPRSPKKVAVIGGGPAGMKCAIDLCDRNHNVTIYEAESELGGAIRTADHADFKWPVKQFKEYCIRQIEKRDIEVKLNTKITPDELKKADYDIVVAAVGAVPLKPPIPGLDGDNVFYAPDVFLNRKGLGTNVVIIGGGEVGVECGMYLAKSGHEVTVLEMRDLLAADTTPIHYRSMFEAAWEAIPQFHSILNAKVAGVSKEGVTYLDREGKEEFISADSVVVSAGMQSKKEEALSFYGTADEFYMIGDCKKPATILEAMRTAFATAAQI